MMMGRTRITIDPKGQVVHLRTKKPVEPRLLDGKPVKVADKEDPRKALAAWMTAADNPYFARAMANWVWAQLFGKGLVDPPDDMSRANPPVHPELLDALARHFVEHKYDLRDLIRTVATSEAYGLSSGTVAGQREGHAAVLASPAPPAHGPPDGRRAGPGDRRAQLLPERRPARQGFRRAAPSRSPTRRRAARSSTRSADARGPPPAPPARRRR